MPHLLHVETSPREEHSLSRTVAAEYVSTWLAATPSSTSTLRDLARTPPPFVTDRWISAAFTPPEHRGASADALGSSDELVAEVEAADVLVLSSPVYNVGIPAALKAWVDQVVRVGRTFAYGEQGPYGLLEGRRAVVIRASGSDLTTPYLEPLDFHTPYLRGVLGFIGIEDVETVLVNAVTPDEAQLARAAGAEQARALAGSRA